MNSNSAVKYTGYTMASKGRGSLSKEDVAISFAMVFGLLIFIAFVLWIIDRYQRK